MPVPPTTLSLDSYIENIEPISDAASLKGANNINPQCNWGLGYMPDGTSPRGGEQHAMVEPLRGSPGDDRHDPQLHWGLT